MFARLGALAVLVAGGAALLWAVFAAGTTDTADTATTTAAASAAEQARESAGAADADDAEVADTVVDPTSGSAGGEAAAEPVPEPTATPVPFPEPENFGPRMDLVDLDGWLNTDATQLSDFDGQVLLIEMWTFGCHNCQARIPFNQSYAEEFGEDNFEIIGVHAPEFRHEADVDNIIAAMDRLGVDWPVALDTEKKNFREWQPGRTNFWPRTYVVDQNGDVRYDHIGEGKYEELRETIRFLLENPPAPASSAAASS